MLAKHDTGTHASTVPSDAPRAGWGGAARLQCGCSGETKGRKSVELEMPRQPIESTRGQVEKAIVYDHFWMNMEPMLSPVHVQTPSRCERQADDVSVRLANH